MAHETDRQDLIDPQTLTGAGDLHVVATRIVEGYLAGRHRSPHKGGCVEFAEHRPYSPGDEVHLIDWRAYARSDRYYIRQFEEETNLQAILVLDGSGSMGFGLEGITKFRYAQILASCLARLLLHQGDAVGMAVCDRQIRSYIPPRSNPSHFRVLLDPLTDSRCGGETSLASVLGEVGKRLKRRGMVIVLSDCFEEEDRLIEAMHLLRVRGHELWLLHVMAPEELSFSFSNWSTFQCLEGTGRLQLDPAVIRKRYLQRVEAFLERIRQGCADVQCDYSPVTTDQPIGPTLGYYLRRRMAHAT